jgi:hypothetical protein
MARNVLDYIKILKSIGSKSSIDSIVSDVIQKNKSQIIDINLINLDSGLDNKDRIVGTYLPTTQARAEDALIKPNQSKIAGQPFNFDWTGQFINRIYITYRSNKIKFLSRGMGDSEKRTFIETNNLLGVSQKGSDIINNEIIRPQVIQEIKNRIVNGS